MAAINFRGGYEFDPETYATGGLPGMLRRAMQEQGLQEQGVDLGSTPNGASDYYPDNYGSPQGGLLGRLIAAQAEQSRYQPVPEDRKSAPFAPQDPNFRQLSRISAPVQQEGAIDPSANSGDHSSLVHPPLGVDPVAQPKRSFSDRLQASWERPHPHGLMAILKEGLSGVEQAVQSSVDATSLPLTEEEAFKRNQGRELGPVGAFKVASVLAPTLVPGGAGGVFAIPLAGALRNGLPWLPPGARFAGQGANGPIVAGLEGAISRSGELAAKRRDWRRAQCPQTSRIGRSSGRSDLWFGERWNPSYR